MTCKQIVGLYIVSYYMCWILCTQSGKYNSNNDTELQHTALTGGTEQHGMGDGTDAW